ncbi:DeoR family transcriptional regulator [Salimicrobium jeotgali]|uniref:DeoR family transcriptional regulator n=5 Tax=Salimicrobium TaxID=351195 RepID=K2GA29_9BACI|nr:MULTISPECIES: DeoR family transcriptional regulator [Salimicrobium]EKE31177.1 DeoR family transcriptional regulator [Salimicrobium jeotgali]MBM7697261.1 DeoR/GlpR family transcriptional regulator of sugar metabolism [Salimicrobium jeotgali]SDX57197.1 DeoR-like helix-turn-helix domain-containing protein [Salimicrobium album]SIS95267.1 DeoR-like helix-turn-helix domain-containing protein [Salimicrobium salexigens]
MNRPSTRMLDRIKSTYLFIKTEGTVSTAQVAEEFGITDRTVQRDLHVLEYNGLVCSPYRGKWKTTEKKVKAS